MLFKKKKPTVKKMGKRHGADVSVKKTVKKTDKG